MILQYLSFNKICVVLFRVFIFLYQKAISPILHFISLSTVGGGCRFYPSCSEYCKQTIDKYGVTVKSIKMVLSRLLRCQPFFESCKKKSHGYDPVD